MRVHMSRWLPRISLPTVRGRCAAVSLGRDAALFYAADTGEIDVFNSTCLCWTSYKVSFVKLAIADMICNTLYTELL
jgi:hypothetical protein